MHKARLAYLFDRYTRHECTTEELQEFMALVEECDDETLHQLLDDAYTGQANYELADAPADRILNNILQAKPASRLILGKSFYWLGGIAATILLGIIFYKKPDANLKAETKPQPQLSQNVRSINDHRLIKLADGSTVILNKNSRLSYSEAFNSKLREVTLVGEGYFDVKHNPSKPFLVHAGNLTITVLGTAFNIKTANKIAVTVTRGKVSVSNLHKLLGAITPGQQISYDPQTQQARQISVNAQNAVKWQASDLFFDNVTMQQAATILESRFGVGIRFKNENSKSLVFSASFTHGQNLQQIMKVICAFNDITYDEQDDVITIK